MTNAHSVWNYVYKTVRKKENLCLGSVKSGLYVFEYP